MSVQEQMVQAIDGAAECLIDVSRQIHDTPELRFEEHLAATTLTDARTTRTAQARLNAAKAMALTTYDLLSQPDFLAAAKEEWNRENVP